MFVQYLKWLIYLRKSRQDDQNETVEEVLSKHERLLQEYALREFGGEIPEENIYREVVSGESIESRVEIKKVLARIEDPEIIGVLVVEPQRLSRGDLVDCGRLIDAFRFTKTQVATLVMVYDLENKMERKFFQDELLRGRDFLEYTKEILLRGKIAAVKRGCYINPYAPYGYDRVKKGKDHTLEENADGDVVRMIFDLYTREGVTPNKIAQRLNHMEIPGPDGPWRRGAVRDILTNIHYIGKVAFGRTKRTQLLQNGEVVTKLLNQPEKDWIVAEGKHSAIIDQETWDKAQEQLEIGKANSPRIKNGFEIKNPLAGVLRCSGCGLVMRVQQYKNSPDRYDCPCRPRCRYKTAKVSDIMDALIVGLERSELPALEIRLKNGDGNAREIQKRLLAKLEKQLEEYRDQEETQYELLETKKYTQEVFDKRNAALRAKMEDCQAAIHKARENLPKNVDYAEKIILLQDAIAALRSDDITPAEQNKAIKAIVEKVIYKGPEKGTTKKGHTPFTLDIFLKL